MKKAATTTGLVCAATAAVVSGGGHHGQATSTTPLGSYLPCTAVHSSLSSSFEAMNGQTQSNIDCPRISRRTKNNGTIRNHSMKRDDVVLLKNLIRKVRGGAATPTNDGNDTNNNDSLSSSKKQSSKKKKTKKKTSTKIEGEEKMSSSSSKVKKDAAKNSTKQSTKKSTASTSGTTSSHTKSAQSTRKASPSASTAKKNTNNKTQNSSSSSSNNSSKDASSSQHHRASKIVQEILNHGDDYYGILGITKTATSVEIQKAYRRRAVQTHPDKMSNGDRQAFDKVAEAYDVLSDDTKRAIYNQHGKSGLQHPGGVPSQGGGVEEMFRSFFGGSAGAYGNHHHHGRQREPPKPKNRTVRYQLEVTLEELYQGMTRSVIVEQGNQPSYYRQQQQQRQERKRVEVHIPKGYASGQSIVLSGEMDSVQDATPADLVFLLAQRKHPIFTRKGHDLAMEVPITLEEAICGVQRSFRHLDGRMVSISSAKYDPTTMKQRPGGSDSAAATINEEQDRSSVHASLLVQDGDVQVLKGEGMPKPHTQQQSPEFDGTTTSEYGDLYIQFRVEMPSSTAMEQNLNDEERTTLQHLLEKLQGHAKPKFRFSDAQEVLPMQPSKTSDFGRASGIFRMDQQHQHDHPDEGEEESGYYGGAGARGGPFPFGGGGRGFSYFSSSFGGNGGGGPFGGGSPFFGQQPSDDDVDDDGNVQCQQM